MARLKGGMGVAPSLAWGQKMGTSRARCVNQLRPDGSHRLNAGVLCFASLDLLQRGEGDASLLRKHGQLCSGELGQSLAYLLR